MDSAGCSSVCRMTVSAHATTVLVGAKILQETLVNPQMEALHQCTVLSLSDLLSWSFFWHLHHELETTAFQHKACKTGPAHLASCNNLVVRSRLSCTLCQPQTHYIAKDNPELLIFLPPPSEIWAYRLFVTMYCLCGAREETQGSLHAW